LRNRQKDATASGKLSPMIAPSFLVVGGVARKDVNREPSASRSNYQREFRS
jgi:hypothetical protein